MINIMGKNYLNDKEASVRYGFSQQWFKLCRNKKQGPPFIKLIGKVYYILEETDKWFSDKMIKNK